MTTFFKSIPSHSSSKTYAASVINAVLTEHPNWYPAAAALVSFPIQRWASQQRQRIKGQLDDLAKVLRDIDANAYDDSYFKRHGNDFDNTSEILSLTEELLSAEATTKIGKRRIEALNCIHDSKKHDTSAYIIKTHYEPAFRSFCTKNYRLYRKYIEQAVSSYKEYVGDLQYAYHNTDILIRMYWVMCTPSYIQKSSVDFTDAAHAVDDAIEALQKYPFNGKEIYFIVRRIANGDSERKLEREIGKSRKYVSNRYKEGIYAVSCILWGYSSREIADAYMNYR